MSFAEWLATLDDGGLTQLEMALSSERQKRAVIAPLVPGDSVDEEIAKLESEWAQTELEERARKMAESRERMENNRERLLKREWFPDCRCRGCLRGVLKMDPRLVCPTGMSRGRWW